MLTLFDLVRLLAMFVGAVVLGAIGWSAFGVVGCLVGVPSGVVLGAIIGQVPLVICLKRISLRFDQMTDQQLRDELHDPGCRTLNLVLLELERRGCNIDRELPFVQSLVTSEKMDRRMAGWAALTSVFPQAAGQVPGYRPTATTAECQSRCRSLQDTDR